MRHARALREASEKQGPQLWDRLSRSARAGPMRYAQAMLDYSLAQMRWHNFFVESQPVVSFLETSPILAKDMEAIGSIINEKFVTMNLEGFFVHLASRKQSIFVRPFGTADGLPAKRLDGGLCRGWVAWMRGTSSIEYDAGFFPISTDALNDRKITDIEKVIANLALYIDAFPECVRDGPPELVVGSVVGQGSTQIGGHQSIRESMAHGNVSPHMRRGHFRFLQSERYTSKRFQTVFVKPSMVKSSAETVSEYA